MLCVGQGSARTTAVTKPLIPFIGVYVCVGSTGARQAGRPVSPTKHWRKHSPNEQQLVQGKGYDDTRSDPSSGVTNGLESESTEIPNRHVS